MAAAVYHAGGESCPAKLPGWKPSIDIGPDSTVQSFQLHQLLSDYGKPDKILIKTYSNTPASYLPFRLVLFYSSQQIMAFFEYEAQKNKDILVGCPQPVGPWLTLWGWDRLWSDKDIDEAVSGPDSPQPLRPLEEVTDMSVDDFYQTFKDSQNTTCITTPADLW